MTAETPTPHRRRRRGRTAVVAIAVLGAAGAATAAALGLGGGSSGTAATSDLPPNTAEVTKRTLTDTETVDGELGYGPKTTAASRVPGTLTYVPEAGSQVSRGKPLYKVDNKPVILMYGSMPAYRPLREGDEGPDVKQFEQNLSALGYRGFTVDDEYTESTAEAVERWQEDLGLDETGAVELGRVVFAAGAVRVDSIESDQGDAVAPGKGVLSYTGTAKAVTVELETSDQRLAKAGAKVVVELPDGDTTAGTVDEVSTVIEPGNGQDQEPQTKIEVIVALPDQKATSAYALASVDVTFTAAERKDVLAVPVTALLALQEGGFGVEVVEGATTRYVPVKTGLFSGGLVEVTGAGIAAGTVVGVPK